jgi:large subunit ribosomal protein L7/L12
MKINELVEEIGKLPVIELAELVKALEEKFGVSAAMPAAVSAAAPAASAVPAEDDEKSEYKVTLKNAGDQKIKVIKALRSVTTLTLKEARDIADSAPCMIAESASKEDAQKMKEALESAGGVVELS